MAKRQTEKPAEDKPVETTAEAIKDFAKVSDVETLVAGDTERELTPKEIAALEPVWIRFQQQPNQPAGASQFGPFMAPDGPAKERLEPGVGKRVNGMWAYHLRRHRLAQTYGFEFSDKPFPDPAA